MCAESALSGPLKIERLFCLGGWAGCREIYTGGHRCKREDGHSGRCRCICGASTTQKPPRWEETE